VQRPWIPAWWWQRDWRVHSRHGGGCGMREEEGSVADFDCRSGGLCFLAMEYEVDAFGELQRRSNVDEAAMEGDSCGWCWCGIVFFQKYLFQLEKWGVNMRIGGAFST